MKAQGRRGLAPVALSPFRQVGRGSWRLCLLLPAFVEQRAASEASLPICRLVGVAADPEKKEAVNPVFACPASLPSKLSNYPRKTNGVGCLLSGVLVCGAGGSTGVTKQGWNGWDGWATLSGWVVRLLAVRIDGYRVGAGVDWMGPAAQDCDDVRGGCRKDGRGDRPNKTNNTVQHRVGEGKGEARDTY